MFNLIPQISGEDVQKQILKGLSNDGEIRNFCLSWVQKEPNFILGFDPSNPPKNNLYPWIGTLLSSFNVSDDYGAFIYNISIGAAIELPYKKNIDKSFGIYVYNGTTELEQFGRLILNNIFKNIVRTPENDITDLLDAGQVQINNSLPFASLYFDISVSVPLYTEEQ